MAGMTETQYQLGLGMMAADIGSRLSLAQRAQAVFLLEQGKGIPTAWHVLIEMYLADRQATREEGW